MELRVRFAETDQMRVAHHAAYAVWLEAARVEWLRGHGLRYRDLEEAGVSLAVAGLTLRYAAAAHFDDLLRIEVVLREARSRRLAFGYRIERVDEAPRLLATAETVHVPTDARGRAVRLPADWLSAIRDLAARDAAVAPARGAGPRGGMTGA